MPRAKTPRTNGKKQAEPVIESNVTTMPQVTAAATAVSPELKKFASPIPINLEEEIRRRAYELYEERGCVPGQDHSDWVQAEREVLARYTQQSA